MDKELGSRYNARVGMILELGTTPELGRLLKRDMCIAGQVLSRIMHMRGCQKDRKEAKLDMDNARGYSWSQKVMGHMLGGLFDSKYTACFTNRFPSFDSANESVFGRSVILSARSLIIVHAVDKNEDGVGIKTQIFSTTINFVTCQLTCPITFCDHE